YAMIASKVPSRTPDKRALSNLNCPNSEGIFADHTPIKPPAHPLVVRGAVSAVRTRFPIPLSIRACGFPAHGLSMIFCAWLRCLRVADGAAKSVQAVPVEPLLGPLIGVPATEVAAPLLNHQAEQPPRDVFVDLSELVSGVAGAKVVAPAAQDRIQYRDQIADVSSDPVAPGEVADLDPYPGHSRLAGPAVQVITHDAALFPQPPRHARPEMTTQKIQAAASLAQVDDLRLIRMQPQPQPGQNLLDRGQSVLGLCRAAAQHHTIVGVAHQLPHLAS